jgi:uncharacterized protein (TIGR03435 family)
MRGASNFALIAALASAALCQEFEAVSVKPNKSINYSSSFTTDPGRLTAMNVSLKDLIVRAYGVQDFQVEGPDWLGSERFDVSATFPQPPSKDKEKSAAAFGAMMQAMLADRFQLMVHRELKTRPVYGLMVGKSGIKFKKAPESDCGSHSRKVSGNHYVGTCVSMDSFAAFLATRRRDLPVDLPVLDMTGLNGFYNLTLDWVREPAVGDSQAGVTLLVALQEQLGLKLETRSAPIEIVVVDHAQRAPSEN